MQTTAIRTVANSLPQNEVILLTLLISKRYIPYTDLQKICEISVWYRQINTIKLRIRKLETRSLVSER